MNASSQQPIDILASTLESAVDRYCRIFPDRPGYAEWRQIRVHQEDYQYGAVQTLRILFGSRLAESSILDVGAGMGGYVVALRRLGLHCDGIEYNEGYVEICRLRAMLYNLSNSVIHGAAEALPYADATYDIIHCHDVLEHCQNPEKALHEMYRVLKPGGSILVTFINRLAAKDPHYHLWGVNWLPRWLGTRCAERYKSRKNTEYADRQGLDEMHYFPAWIAMSLVKKIGFTGIRNVRRIKIANRLQQQLPFFFRFWGASVIVQGITLIYAVWEYAFGQNYYWILTK